MGNLVLKTRSVDLGYPDMGHDEYVLVRVTKRKSKFWQYMLGDKEDVVLWYGEDKPTNERLAKDILKFK